MAMYDFDCTSCDTRFEASVPMHDIDRTVTCGCGAPARRCISAIGLSGQGGAAGSAALPTSLAGLGGSREGVALWRSRADAMARRQERHPEPAPSVPRSSPHCASYATTGRGAS